MHLIAQSSQSTISTIGIQRIEATLPRLYMLAAGGTAVGTGLNTRYIYVQFMYYQNQFC
jgi:fumarate hydratase class II